MSKSRFAGLLTAGLAVLLFAGGCMHYRVTDTSTNRRYYTTTEESDEAGGTISFIDAKTSRRITIHQTYKVEPITAEAYSAAVGLSDEELATLTEED